MQKNVLKTLPENILEMLGELPNPRYKYGDGKHPCFKPWKSMIDRCSNPNSTAFPAYGGRLITITHDWYAFEKFVADMEASFEIAPDKPFRLRRNFLSRYNLRAGFNPDNCFWDIQSSANQIQAHTKFIDTVFGKSMSFRELARHLEEHAGQVFSPAPGLFQRITVISWQELRRRHNLGLPMFEPVRQKGKKRYSYIKQMKSGIATVDWAGDEHDPIAMSLKAEEQANAPTKIQGVIIESGIPLPPPKRYAPNKYAKYRFGLMEVGEDVFVVGATVAAVRANIATHCRAEVLKRFAVKAGYEVPVGCASGDEIEGVYVRRTV